MSLVFRLARSRRRVLVGTSLALVGLLASVPLPSGASNVEGKLVLQESGFAPSSRSTWWAVMEPTVTARSFVFRTVTSGRTWKDVSPTTAALASSYFLGSEYGWAEVHVTNGSAPPLFVTRNGGRSWRELARIPSQCTLDFVDPEHGWCTVLGAAAGSEGVQLYRTTDGGTSWTLVSDTSLTSVNSTPGTLPGGCDKVLTFISVQVGFASFACNGGTAALYKTSDGGSSWQALPPPKPLSSVQGEYGEYLGVPTVHGSDIALSVSFGKSGETQIATSSDGGATWAVHGVPGSAQHWDADIIDQRDWTLSNGKTLMATENEGRSWRMSKPKISLQDPTSFPLNLLFLSPRVGWVVPGPNGGRLWSTNDGGQRWERVSLPSHPSS